MLIFYQKIEPIKYNYIIMPKYIELKATYYNNTPAQGWGDGQITASGKRLYGKNVDELRYVAMSRDMIKPTRYHKEIHGYNPDAPFEFGDLIMVKNSGVFDGEWIVADAMHQRHKKRIDFLVSTKSKIKFKAHKIVKVSKINTK